MLGGRGRSRTPTPPPNYRRRLNLYGLESGQDERRGEVLCAGGDKCRGEGVCMANCPCNRNEQLGEDECQDDLNGNEDDPRDEDHDTVHGSDHGNDYEEKSGRRGGGRSRGIGRRKRKCRSRGAAAPPPWIVDPRRPCAEEGNIDDVDLGEEEFFPSRQIEANEEGQHQAIGCVFPPALLTQPPEPENQVLHYPGHHFVLDLVLACRCFLSNENDSIMKIFQFLNETNQYSAESQKIVMAFDSLENLAARCSQAEENIAVTHFVFMLNAIQLRCKVIRFVFSISCL